MCSVQIRLRWLPRSGAFVLPRGWESELAQRSAFILADLNFLPEGAASVTALVELARNLQSDHVLGILMPARARVSMACEAQLHSVLADEFDLNRIWIPRVRRSIPLAQAGPEGGGGEPHRPGQLRRNVPECD